MVLLMNEYFKYEELEEATESFSPSHLIGKGSHGCIYKGVLKGGRVVAVKKPSPGLQKLHDNSKLHNEINILSSMPKNSSFMVNFIGSGHDPARRQVLVMDFMPNGTLHSLLHATVDPPTWVHRVQMAVQIARSIQFLHDATPVVVHRDINPANIMFDSSWNARLGDFGLAIRLNEGGAHPIDPPAGTIGYLDPGYTTPGSLSTKIDVFSFGVVLLEIISGTKAINVSRTPTSIVEWGTSLIEAGRMVDIYDKRVNLPSCMEGTIWRMLCVASRCLNLDGDYRPSMTDVVIEMESRYVERFRLSFMHFLHELVKRRYKMIKNRRINNTAIDKKFVMCINSQISVEQEVPIRKAMLLREILLISQ